MASSSPPGTGPVAWSHWDVICIAARLPAHAEAYKRELLRRKRADGAASTPPLLLAVGDPGEVSGDPTAFRIGSGGAVLNALLLIAEHLSALAGENNVDTGVLQGRRLLVLNVGDLDQRVPAFSRLPTPLRPQPGRSSVLSTLDLLLGCLTGLAERCPPGLFVVSSQDSCVMLGNEFSARFGAAAHRSEGKATATALALAVPARTAAERYAVYEVDGSETVRRMLARGSLGELKEASDGHVTRVTGIVFFNQVAVVRLFTLAIDAAFESCTYYGIDNGAQPRGFSFFLDLLAILGQDASVEGLANSSADPDLLKRMWQVLHGYIHLAAVTLGSEDLPQYRSVQSPRDYIELVAALAGEEDVAAAGTQHCQNTAGSTDPSARILSSSLTRCKVGPRAIVESSTMEDCAVGEGSSCCGIKGLSRMEVPPGLFLQQLSLLSSGTLCWDPGAFCLVTVSPSDWPGSHSPSGGFMGQPWPQVMECAGLSPTDLWDEEEGRHTLQMAKLFPVVTEAVAGSLACIWLEYATCLQKEPRSNRRAHLDLWRRQWSQVWRQARRLSISEVHAMADVEVELDWQDSLNSETNKIRARQLLLDHRDMPLRHILHDEVHRQRWGLLDVFDTIAAGERTPVDVVARALAQIAEVLAAFGGSEGGLRSGTARNPQWQSALVQLASESPGKRRLAVLAMQELRSKWLGGGPVALIRAARHYEAAAQVMIFKAVATCSEFISILPGAARPPHGHWAVVESPARIDVAGGWTDTPPVCYDYGGTVVNLALLVDGHRPLGAMARLLPHTHELVFELWPSRPSSNQMHSGQAERVVCKTLSDLEDHNSPSAPAALLKCCVLCCGFASLAPGAGPLGEQLKALGGGLHLSSWSALPQGSGLGSSSILAGAAIKALSLALGREMDVSSIIHAVQNVEQMLTTGGGWQDQVGGLIGGAKITRSAAHLPLHVVPEVLDIPQDFVAKLSKHMVLVFTGRPRLAKHLLQNVIRQWFSRLPAICANVERLVATAERAGEALRTGDLPGLGACLNDYWEQKKVMAPGSEPKAVTEWRESLSEGLLGFTLAGAGGGGFAMLLTKEPDMGDWVQRSLTSCTGMEGSYISEVAIDFEGLAVSWQE